MSLYSVSMIDIMPFGYELVTARVGNASQVLVFNEIYDHNSPRLETYSSYERPFAEIYI